jgi:hypothetical protein
MSGTWPASPEFAAMNFINDAPAQVSLAASGVRHVADLTGQRWRATASYPPMTRAQFAPIAAFVAAQRGQYGSFKIVLPILSTPLGDISASTPLVNGADQTGRSLITDGWANSQLVLKAGDVFKLASNDKVYMVTSDGTSDGSGNLTLAIEPALVASPADNEALTVTAVPFTMALAGNPQEFPARPGGFFSYEVDMVEALS